MFLLLLLFINPSTSQIPRNLVQEYIKTHADFSIDPCDDFYSHVCSAHKPRDFVRRLFFWEALIVNRHKRLYLGDIDMNEARNQQIADILESFWRTEDAEKLCDSHRSLFQRIVSLAEEESLDTWEKLPCKQALKEISKTDKKIFLNQLQLLSNGFEKTIVNMELISADKRVHELFLIIKAAIREEFVKTPWALNKRVVDKFLRAIDDIHLISVADYRSYLLEAIDEFREQHDRCLKLSYVPDRAAHEAICHVLAGVSAKEKWENVPKVWPEEPYNSKKTFYALLYLEDTIAANVEYHRNGTVRAVLVDNKFLMQANTDYDSDFYGLAGTILAHELMHSFVFHDKDQSDLKPFWTNSSDCVKKQMKRTCATFPTSKCLNSSFTFEEDAADLAAVRAVWKAFQKKNRLSKGSGIDGIEELTEDQLFFYAQATNFCEKWPSAPGDDKHSSFHHRINSVASQMNEFFEAFKCKKTDRMVENRADYCVIYGEDAPETKMMGGGSFLT